jgi:hypothetical protein
MKAQLLTIMIPYFLLAALVFVPSLIFCYLSLQSAAELPDKLPDDSILLRTSPTCHRPPLGLAIQKILKGSTRQLRGCEAILRREVRHPGAEAFIHSRSLQK